MVISDKQVRTQMVKNFSKKVQVVLKNSRWVVAG